MKFINWTNLPRWSSRMATARSCLPPTATQDQRSALATSLEIGFQLGLDVLRDGSRPLLTVNQGRYTHLALLEQLGHLPTELRVIPIRIEVPTPALPSLSIEEGVVEVEGRAVLSDGEIRQVHLLIGHGSINTFASPQNEARFKMAIGMVSYNERKQELIFRITPSTYWSIRPKREYRRTRSTYTPGQTFPPRKDWTHSSAATPLLHLCKWSASAADSHPFPPPKSQSKSWIGSSQEDSTTYPTMMPETRGPT